MIKLPHEISDRDIGQWLCGGVSLLNQTIPVVVSRDYLDDEDEGMRISVFTVQDKKQIPAREWRNNLYAHWPRLGALNVGGSAFFLQRGQVAQYRRTYHPACLRRTQVNVQWNGDRTRLAPSFLSWEVVSQAFSPVYYYFEDAVRRLAEGAPSVAINPCLILTADAKGQIVYYNGKLVGRIDNRVYTPTDAGLTKARAAKLLGGSVSVNQ